jgi:hypothetical protein
MIPTVNNFKLVGTYDHEPPYLSEYKEIMGFKVYSSSYAPNLYVILNNKDKPQYFAFQSDGNSKNIDKDLMWNIKVYFIGFLD